MRIAIGALLVLMAAPAGAEPLRIATKHAPPFSYKEDGQWHGLAIDLWDDIAGRAHLDYVLVEVPLASMLEELRAGQIDGAVAALTITAERENGIDFTHGFYTSGLAIAVHRDRQRLDWGALLPMARTIVYVFAAIFAFANIIRIVERKQGWSMVDAFHFTNTSATSTGYGDYTPKTTTGKIMADLWQWVGIASFGLATAAATTLLQARPMTVDVPALRNLRVAAMQGTTAARFLEDRKIPYISDGDLLSMAQEIVDHKIDAIVYDEPLLRYEIRKHALPLQVVGGLTQETYGIALPEGSALRETVNRHLLEITASHSWKDTVDRYIPAERAP